MHGGGESCCAVTSWRGETSGGLASDPACEAPFDTLVATGSELVPIARVSVVTPSTSSHCMHCGGDGGGGGADSSPRPGLVGRIEGSKLRAAC
eukprot:6201029-Prymnesium_polylepis.1